MLPLSRIQILTKHGDGGISGNLDNEKLMNRFLTKGKSRLIRELRAKGLSVRKATKAVNAVFNLMAGAVKRGEIVDIPGGTIKANTRNGKPRATMQQFRNIQTDEIDRRIVRYPGQRRVVKFRPDETLDLTPLPLPPTPEALQCRNWHRN
jgi:nucleoid DNA-binding protein